MLLLYSLSTSTRLQYIVNFFSHELFDRPVRITNDRNEYIQHRGPKINYSPHEITPNEFFILPVPLLFEHSIKEQDLSCFEVNYHKAFFQTQGTMPFDVFAASFYLLSRYEEYLPHRRDEYGRYWHINSLAFSEGFLNQPLVNMWVHEFKSALSALYPYLKFKGKQFSNVVTYDIDIAYAYLHKGWYRNLGGMIRSLYRREWKSAWERWQVLTGKKKDPFDCYEWLDALHLYCRLKPYYFFLVAKNNSKYDRNISTSSKRFRELVEYYANTYNVGIHPSWQSGDDVTLLKEEIEWLEVVADRDISASRQHYIRFNLPETYRRLVQHGIRKDFSMGYGTINGFRASVCTPFKWYDLSREETTALTVYPFCFMDANAYFEQKSNPQQAYDELMQLYNSVRKVNGMMITIWHNHLLGSDEKMQEWSRMFELFMKETVYWDAYYDGSKELSEDLFFSRVFS
jgi:hypothetical protein